MSGTTVDIEVCPLTDEVTVSYGLQIFRVLKRQEFALQPKKYESMMAEAVKLQA